MIGARLFGAILAAGGLLAPTTVGERKVTMWTPSWNRRNGAQHDPARVAAAEAKREMRRAKVRRQVNAGGYGLTPRVGTKGYVPNTPCGARVMRERALGGARYYDELPGA